MNNGAVIAAPLDSFSLFAVQKSSFLKAEAKKAFLCEASSPKCVLWTMKRGEDGVAVKVYVPPQGTNKLLAPQESVAAAG